MRILLAHNSTYYPAQGGGDKSNRLLMEALASRGHRVTVFGRTAGHGAEAHRELLSELALRDVSAFIEEKGIVQFARNGVEVHVATDNPRAYFVRLIESFEPDVILASTDDSAQIFLRAALNSKAAVVYMARATIALPFGPDTAFQSEDKMNALREADGVVGVSHYVANYIRRHSGIDAVHIPISLMDGGPWSKTGSYTNEFVTMINPCLVKGIDIFLALAQAFPNIGFAGVRSWGTTEEDLRRLNAQPNVTVLEPVDNIDDIFVRTRVLLVPSIWAEARARVVQEGMLRGIPVIASDTGGLSEAKLGVPYLLPVRQIERYHGTVDEQMVPEGEAPVQDLNPWRDALGRLTSEPLHWADVAARSREAALDYSRQLTAEPFEKYLAGVLTSRRPRGTAVKATLANLTLEQKKLLALKMRSRRSAETAADTWLVKTPGEWPGNISLICFPYAAAGPNVYRNWPGVTAIHYPGREARSTERLLETPGAMLDALMEHVAPQLVGGTLSGRFAFFGHSMGAGLAFEFARRLSKAGMVTPLALLVSAASGPRMRVKVHPDPDDDELFQRLAAMNPGRPHKVLQTIFPMFKADTGLYRRYVYEPGEPLAIPIRAYGGTEDPFVPAASLERWHSETSAGFSSRYFEGGHLFMEDGRQLLLHDIQEYLNGLE